MKTKEKICKTILSDSGIYDVDYSINPYTGCSHSCKYCYATYMKKFTDHKEEWGTFVDIKKNAPEILNKEIRNKKKGKILLSSVTDPYQPIEKNQKITKSILNILKDTFFDITLLTKSDLITRDIDLLKEAKGDVSAGLTINYLEERHRKIWEPQASPIEERIKALKKLKNHGIHTYVHIGPFFPEITDLKNLIREIEEYVEKIEIENLNDRNKTKILETIKKHYPNKLKNYKKILENQKNTYDQELIEKAKEIGKETDTEINIYID